MSAGGGDTPDEADLALVRLAQEGDLTAFNRLVLRHQDAVYTLCYRLSANAEDAADATQEAFLSAYRHLPTLRGQHFRSWLLRIGANACYDLHRQRARRPTTPIGRSVDGEESDGGLEPADTSPGPEASAMHHELGEVLQGALMALPEEQRLAVVLCDLYGFDYQAIADTCGVEMGTVKSRLNRARRRLRDLLLPYREQMPASPRPT